MEGKRVREDDALRCLADWEFWEGVCRRLQGRYPCDPSLATHSWFHGKITREQAERLLYPPETGLFLVRESTNYPGDYTLCVSCEGKVEHYRIMYHASKLSIDEEVYFENLMQLVEVSGVHAFLGVTSPFSHTHA